MNKAITDGLVFMPPPFSAGLGVWSSGDGTAGSDTYAGSANGAFVPADQNFTGCLEVVKTSATTRVRYMGQTPILPGCYLQVTVRVKAVSGALPAVRIAGLPVDQGVGALTGVPLETDATPLTAYGEVVTIRKIIGTGNRQGVDLVWTNADYAYIGLDLTGPNGGVVRIDDIEIEDVTGVFLRDMVGYVDVRDYGAVGDGVTNDYAAFEAADADANGRTVLVSAGTYFLGNHTTIQSEIDFAGGTVTMPDDKRLLLQRNYDYPTYLDAFGNEELAFRKAFQALLNYTDHDSLDLCGRRVALSGPMDLQAAEGSRKTFHVRRIIRNGLLEPAQGSDWTPTVVTAQASYDAASPYRLTNVANVGQIQVGSLVEGSGVGREIYVRAVDVAAAEVTLSQQLYDAEGTQTFTFTRFKYLLDFTGFDDVSLFGFADIDFNCAGQASGVILSTAGLCYRFRDCFFTRPADRGITSPGAGCRGMQIDRCQFLSNEQALTAPERTTVAINVSSNDAKIRDNRVVMFKYFAVMAGSGYIIANNHWFAGDTVSDGVRNNGLIFTSPNVCSTVVGNYIDTWGIEWTNEHDASPAIGQQFSFGGLTITGNFFVVNDGADWYRFITLKPYGPGHFINGLTICDNVFRAFSGYIDRVEMIDTTFADMNHAAHRNFTMRDNVFHGIREEVSNPLDVVHAQATPERVWTVGPFDGLPFGGRSFAVESLTTRGRVADAADEAVYDSPWIDPGYGAGGRQFRVVWKVDTTGSIRARVRIDEPL